MDIVTSLVISLVRRIFFFVVCCFFVYNDVPKLTLIAPRTGDGTDYDDGAWKQLKKQVPKYAIFDRMTNVSLY